MTTDRWREIGATRRPRAPSLKPETGERRGLRMLTQRPEWQVLLEFLRREEWMASAGSDGGDALGMARAAGGREMLRRLERLEGEVAAPVEGED